MISTTPTLRLVAAEQQLADQVAFWVDDSGGGSKSALLEIQNRSSVPISDVSATIGFASLPGKPPPPPDSVADFNIGLVPPCSIAIIPLTGHWTGGGPASEFFQNAVSGRTAYLSDLRFTDANDQNWDEDSAGILTPADHCAFPASSGAPRRHYPASDRLLLAAGPLPVAASQHIRRRPVEVPASLVIPASGLRVLMPGEVLNVLQRHHPEQLGDRSRPHRVSRQLPAWPRPRLGRMSVRYGSPAPRHLQP